MAGEKGPHIRPNRSSQADEIAEAQLLQRELDLQQRELEVQAHALRLKETVRRNGLQPSPLSSCRLPQAALKSVYTAR